MTGRERSTDVLNRILTERKAEPRDAGLLHELVMGVLRRRLALEAVVSTFIRRPLDSADPLVVEILLVMAYQALFLGRVPSHARVSSAVDAARRAKGEGASRFVNAVGRALEDSLARGIDLLGPLEPSVRTSIPPFILEQARRIEGAAWTDDLLESLALPAPVSLRVNRRVSDREGLVAILDGMGSAPTNSPWARDGVRVADGSPLRSRKVIPRLAIPQDEASQLVVEALVPRDGERILDLCAGVGVKTSQILATAPGSDVLAVDLDPARLQRAVALCRAMELPAPGTLACDARHMPADLDGRFDAILLDAPCTGLGTLVRRPEVRYVRRNEDIARAASMQREILGAAVRLLRPGGRIVYAVCSFATEEGQDVLASVLAQRPDLSREPAPGPDSLRTPDGDLLTLPWRHGMDGFHIAMLRRT
jgi:16S rRNA (cytosine967-C5)-methyltransferase